MCHDSDSINGELAGAQTSSLTYDSACLGNPDEGLITVHGLHWPILGLRNSMEAIRTSTSTIIWQDQDARATILFAVIGVIFSVMLVLWIMVDGFSRPLIPPESDVDLAIVFLALSVLMGPALLVSSIVWLLKRIHIVRYLLSNGLETRAEVMMMGPLGWNFTRHAIRLRYHHLGRDFDERIVLGESDRYIWRFLRVGDTVTLVVDPDDPRSFVFRGLYEPKETVIERMTTKCQLCGKTIMPDEYTAHFMKKHSGSR